jgi:hypothetical protein
MAAIPHPPYSPDLAPCDFFLFLKMKLKLKGCRFDTIEEIQAKSQRVLDTLDRKGLPGSVSKMEETGVYMREGATSRVMVSFMIFTVSVQNILDTPSYMNAYVT